MSDHANAPQTYTATQVGALVESFQKDQRLLAEAVVGLGQKVTNLEVGVTDIRREVIGLQDWRTASAAEFAFIRSSLQSIAQRMQTAEERLAHR